MAAVLPSGLARALRMAGLTMKKDPRWPDWQEAASLLADWHLHLAKRLGSSLNFDQFAEAWNRALDRDADSGQFVA